MRPVARGAFQNGEPLIQGGVQLRPTHGIASLEAFQDAEKRAPNAARAVSPIRVDRNPLQAGKKQLDDLSVLRGLHCGRNASTGANAGAPGEGRTLNHQIRSLLLYPLSYGGVVRDYTLTTWPLLFLGGRGRVRINIRRRFIGDHLYWERWTKSSRFLWVSLYYFFISILSSIGVSCMSNACRSATPKTAAEPDAGSDCNAMKLTALAA